MLSITKSKKNNPAYRKRTLREIVVFCDAILPNSV